MRFHRSGEQEHSCAQSFQRRGREKLQSGQARHRDVEERYMRRQIPNGLNTLGAIAATCHNMEFVLLAEDTDETPQKYGIVVRYDNTHAAHGTPAAETDTFTTLFYHGLVGCEECFRADAALNGAHARRDRLAGRSGLRSLCCLDLAAKVADGTRPSRLCR